MRRNNNGRPNKGDLVKAIYNDLERSADYSTTQLREIRTHAWNRIFNRPRGDEMAGRSKVRSTLIRDTVYALMSTIMPAYQTDSVVDFEPMGMNDVDQADAESRACNNIFTEDNRGYLNLYNAIFDCIAFRNGIMKVWLDESEESITRRFPIGDGITSAMVMANEPEDERWTIAKEDDDEVTVTIVTERQRLMIQAMEPAYMIVNANQQDQNLQEASSLFERVFYTRSELRERGVSRKIVDELHASQDETITEGVGSSNTDISAKLVDGIADISEAATHDQDRIECYWCHMHIDMNGDGISEKMRFLVSQRKILEEDPVDFFPYASGAAIPVPHRWSGLCIYDILKETEDQETNAMRQMADNLNFANNQRPVYDPGMTEQADVLNGAPGRGIRSKDPGAVGWMPFTDITSNSLSFLQHLEQKSQEQSGGSLSMQTGEGQLVSQVSGISADMQLAPREQRAAQMSRNIAETLVRNTFLLIHQTLRTQWRGPIMFKKADDWVETDPAQWQERNRLNVIPGLSPGERRRQSQALSQVIQYQMMLIQGGSANITTNWKGVYKALHDWMASMELDGAEGYFLNPDGSQSQQGQQAAAMESQQMQQMQMQMQQMQMQMEQFDKETSRLKVDYDRADDVADNEFDRLKLAAELDMKDADIAQANQSQDSQRANGEA